MNPASPLKVPFQDLPLQIRELRAELDPAIDRVLQHGQFILGPEVAAFEQAWAEFCGTRFAIGVGSGTDALQLILRALGIGAGDEVITVANTFIATAEAISYAGAKPVLVDCERENFLIDPAAVAAAITPRTRAIIPVHLYGQPANIAALAAIAEKHGLALIEDAAQAHGATLANGRICGALGRAAAFSFYPGKNLGAFGDGGAITTNNEALAQQLRLLRNWGSVVKYHHEVAGYNSRLDTLQAAILGVKLRRLAGWNERRRAAASWYRAALADCAGLALPVEASWTGRHVYHLFVVRILEHDRDAVARALAECGIQTVVHYPVPIHRQKAYAALGLGAGAFPRAEEAARTVLSLPMFPEMTESHVALVADALRAALARPR
ncbi:MAG TPA: DegT/DnrJ/EryC1/StrS family aminotransferase [Opitutaceae bacterium]|nr:DegT/DnrJ/EryC1/StrS family aminotransferase [Opitutaceae bacterium]